MILAAALAFWGIIVHRVCDWLLQSDWMAANKADHRRSVMALWRRTGGGPGDGKVWWDRHPAAYVHSGIHLGGMLALASLTPWTWWAALAVAGLHLVIDTRTPVALWARLVRQTKIADVGVFTDRVSHHVDLSDRARPDYWTHPIYYPYFGAANVVRMTVDQVFHEVVICALAVLLVLL